MIKIKTYTKDKIPHVIEFERRLRKEQNFWGWEIDQNQVNDIKKSFKDPCFDNAVSLLAYEKEYIIGRIDASLIASHFDGTKRAYLDWICVIKSKRHN